MAASPNQRQLVKFGVFEVDLAAGEIRKAGMRQKLAPQPFQVLQALLERPQEVVTREEFRERIWPDNTFVDYELALKKAINRLREVLGDSAENPRFIETVPRRGYRFIGSLTPPESLKDKSLNIREEQRGNGHEAPGQLQVHGNHLDLESSGAMPPVRAVSGVASARTFPVPRWIWGIAALTTVLLLGAFWWHRPLPQPRIVATRQLTHDNVHKRSMVTDGNRIYFIESFAESSRLAQVSVAGGEVSVINSGTALPDLSDISPDGSELLGTVSTDYIQEQICAFSVLTGSPRRIGDLIGYDPGWARDGRLIFSRGNDVWVAEHDGSSPRKLLTTSGVPWAPQFSPDGIRFSFTLVNPTTSATKLWTARLDGTDPREIVPEWGKAPEECCGKWTPDGRYFVFATAQNNASSLWALAQKSRFGRATSAVPMQLTTGPLWIDDVLPGRNGKQIFIVGTQPKGELVQVDVKTGRFVPILGGIFAIDVDYSRDDRWITYILFPERTLWRSRADGSERLQLTFPPLRATSPRWSPDGRRIAFIAAKPGDPPSLFLINKDRGVPEAISSSAEPQTNPSNPSWSKDGQTIAFSHEGKLEGDTSYIGMVDVKSREITRLAGSEGIESPRWSPDGRYIAALAQDNRVLKLYELQSQKWKTLLRRQEPFGFLNWSRDSTTIYFDIVTDPPTIYRLRLRDAKLGPIVNLNSYRLYPKPDLFALGDWGGLAPGDVPLLVRDISTSEIYAFDVDFP